MVRTGSEPLDVQAAVEFVSLPTAGGVAVFTGTVRSPNGGEHVDHLFYEMWEEKVDAALRRIAAEALGRYGACRAYIAHRAGRVEVGEASVVCAVSAPHRAEAFDACRSLIDTLKETAPIWKKELTTSSPPRWVGMPGDPR